MSTKPQEVILIRGASGSGKTTLAQQWTGLGYVLCEADQFLEQLGYYIYDKAREKEANSFCWERFQNALAAGRSVVVCNTFVRKYDIFRYIERCKQLGIPYQVIRSDRQFENVHGVPETKVKAQRRWMEAIVGETILK